ncbi:hypothetical protein HFN63_05570 [Rhizobium leguminosarum]|uniref:hypothetical protein n=1 Tax=Rhizobium leguminosarum TaxID=384 RepID=UPI001C962F20|nr:hypothetical protein [Rhizobium leguminosarum]MBY5769586.1 hypothetical protein [Rhizobium leguminosarum]
MSTKKSSSANAELTQSCEVKATAADWSEWQDTLVPAGYETVYAFSSREEPEIFESASISLEALSGDEDDLVRLTEEWGLNVVEVKAPSALERLGVERVRAFPVQVLGARAFGWSQDTVDIVKRYFP